MAKQDRAIRTRHTILVAAASVFEERGYQAATITDILTTAGVTKGALYFHFQSKEDLAYGVMAAQGRHMGTVPPRTCKTQEVVDTVLLQTYRLQKTPWSAPASASPWTNKQPNSTAAPASKNGATA